jgi:hypothetical protein
MPISSSDLKELVDYLSEYEKCLLSVSITEWHELLFINILYNLLVSRRLASAVGVAAMKSAMTGKSKLVLAHFKNDIKSDLSIPEISSAIFLGCQEEDFLLPRGFKSADELSYFEKYPLSLLKALIHVVLEHVRRSLLF